MKEKRDKINMHKEKINYKNIEYKFNTLSI